MSPDSAAAHAAIAGVPTIPREADEPVFREPWEARAFALAVALHATGVVAVWTAATSGTHTFRLHIEDQGGLSDDATCEAVVP